MACRLVKGTLADFLEVDGQYEGVVDEFLRDELNYVVVNSWDAANAGVQMLESDCCGGAATFLVALKARTIIAEHNSRAPRKKAFARLKGQSR